MCSSLMTQTGEENRRDDSNPPLQNSYRKFLKVYCFGGQVRPYGAGFGQFDSAFKVGEGILFRANISFNFTHFTGGNPAGCEIQHN